MKIRRLYYSFWLHYILSNGSFCCGGKNGHKCFIFLAADYGNLGDVAITLAQKEYLKVKFPMHEVIEVPASMTINAIKHIKKIISPQDIITIVGGGNMGDLYPDIELLRLMVVQSFPNNHIILFPQTIDYSEGKESNWLQNKSCKIYLRHRNLTMCAREKRSAQIMKTVYQGVDVRLTPDIVMSLDRHTDENRGNYVIFCLRSDKEKNDNSKLELQVIQYCKKLGLTSLYKDTHIGAGRFSEIEKYTELTNLLENFSQSKLVVTDRLHGMIFAFITRTPAIVLPNSNFKIEGCYQWIKSCGFISFIKTIDEAGIISSLINASTDNTVLMNEIKDKLNHIV